MMGSKHIDGSRWRRWDLHLHSPGTILVDNYSDLESYLDKLESYPPVVLGITDYCTIKGYKTIAKHKKEGRLSNVDFLIPNIEFRISVETKQGKGINVHILVDSEDPEHVEKIEKSLGRLTFEYMGEKFSCTQDDLRRLGKKVNSKQTDSRAQLKTGVNNFKPDPSVFKKWYRGEKWLRENSLIAIEAGSADGLSGLQHDSGFYATRSELQRFADIIFSKAPSDREYWLGRGADEPEEIIREYGRLKPCVAASDAHSLDDIENQQPEKFCWIKANPTFEGLKQIIYEPEDRVYIGFTPPEPSDEDMVITDLNISSSGGWFETERIQLNPGLVSIIGSRGSGKTALADLIAHAAGGFSYGTESFLTRAGDLLAGLKLELVWASGRKNSKVVRSSNESDDTAEVKYLSQHFVERLCSQDQDGAELRGEIERVVFETHQETEAASSFQELLHNRTMGIDERLPRIQHTISDFNRQISQLDERTQKKANLLKHRQELDRAIKAKEKQLPQKTAKTESKHVKELDRLEKEKHKIIEQLKSRSQRIQSITKGIQALEELERHIENTWQSFLDSIKDAGEDVSAFEGQRPAVTKQVLDNLHQRKKILESEVKDLRGDSREILDNQSASRGARTLKSIEQEIKQRSDEIKAGKEQMKKLLALKKEIRKHQEEIGKINEELKTISEVIPKKRQDLKDRREKEYILYFQLLQKKKDILEDLYRPLREQLDQAGEDERKLELYVRRTVDLSAWIKAGERLFDLRKLRSLRQEHGSWEDLARKCLLGAWEKGAGEACYEGVVDFFNALKGDQALPSVLLEHYNFIDVADWLFSINHIGLEYGIRYDGTDIENLSPGTRGIVLLILYLAIDTRDRRPLLIDQPEENLDNQSIFEMLIDYIRQARERRQVILITHNPNLVVNTDSDQVIVALANRRTDGLPAISYVSGALEARDIDPMLDGSIRDAVVGILEGGERAFKMREEKLGFVGRDLV